MHASVPVADTALQWKGQSLSSSQDVQVEVLKVMDVTLP